MTSPGPLSPEDTSALWRRTMQRGSQLAVRRRRRQRLLVTLPALVLVLGLTGGVIGAVVATSGRPSRTRGAHSGRTAATGHSHRSNGSTPGTGPAHAPLAVPAGFQPVSFSSVSLERWWVLGSSSCGSSRCPGLVETTDGGRSFGGLPVPATLDVSEQFPAGVRFADASRGWVFGPHLWATSNGGHTWVRQSVTETVIDVEAARGRVFALVCADGANCTRERLLAAPVTGGAWRAVPLPTALVDGASLQVTGDEVLVSNGAASSQGGKPVTFLLSRDGGKSFTVNETPCYAGLGGRVFPAISAPGSLWAACPTGMMASPFVSTDYGLRWAATGRGAEFSNGLTIAPVSGTRALVWPYANSGDIALTTNGGKSFATALRSPQGSTVIWAGLSDPARAYAIVASSAPYSDELWESADGGASWFEVHFRG